jgi:transcriptional regulator of met regulon
MDSYNILMAVYQIQGASDPNHPNESLKERMEEIFAAASSVMRQTGFNPDPEE